MKSSRFELSFYGDGIPVLVGRSDAFTKFHARMEEVIVAQHRLESYKDSFNFAIKSSEPCFDDLYSMVLESIRYLHKQAFQKELSISPTNKRTCWAYVLDENRPAVGVWHNHLRTSTYNTVYYLRANNSDAIDLIISKDIKKSSPGGALEIPVQEGMLLVMPSWLVHKEKPIEQRRGALRISINMEVLSTQQSDVAALVAEGWRSQSLLSGETGDS